MHVLVLGDRQISSALMGSGFQVTSDPSEQVQAIVSDALAVSNFDISQENVKNVPLIIILSNSIADWTARQLQPNAAFVKSLDQAIEILKEVERSCSTPEQPVIEPAKSIAAAVYANKGGVGKTTVAVSIATTLANLRVSTVLCAFDYGGKSLESFFGVEEKCANYIGQGNIDNYLVKVSNNLWVLPSPKDMNPAHVRSEEISEVIEYLKKRFQVVVCDTSPAPWEKEYLHGVFSSADLTYAVVNQSKFSLTETSVYAPQLLLMGVMPERIRIVVNQYDPKLMNLKKVERAFKSGFKKDVKYKPVIAAVIPQGWNEQVQALYKSKVINQDIWLKLCDEILAYIGAEESKTAIPTKTGNPITGFLSRFSKNK